ncbi:hypothetical protein NADE_001377 [Nannochloris sp. 'desiccata']|nr:hypothetical protein NADE_001377 [Chlorella desiccata (nom. nud.)]
MLHRPSHGHLAILATGAAVAVKARAVGKVDLQSLKVASDGESSWTAHIPTCGSIIALGSGFAAFLYCAWNLQISEPTEIGNTKVNINKIITGAILGFIPPVGGAVGFLEARTSKLGKDLEKKMDRNKIDRLVVKIYLSLPNLLVRASKKPTAPPTGGINPSIAPVMILLMLTLVLPISVGSDICYKNEGTRRWIATK